MFLGCAWMSATRAERYLRDYFWTAGDIQKIAALFASAAMEEALDIADERNVNAAKLERKGVASLRLFSRSRQVR